MIKKLYFESEVPFGKQIEDTNIINIQRVSIKTKIKKNVPVWVISSSTRCNQQQNSLVISHREILQRCVEVTHYVVIIRNQYSANRLETSYCGVVS